MKKCPGCGKEWPDETKFCGECGAKLEDTPVVVPEIVPEDTKVEEKTKKIVEPVKPKRKETTDQKGIVHPKKKSWKKGRKIAAVVVIAGTAAVGATVFLPKLGSKIKHPCVQLYGNSYELVTKEKLGHTITITDNAEDWIDHATMQLSPERKYIYYMENYDVSTATARLYRCEYQKLSQKEEKNEKYKMKIAANVRAYYPLKDGKVIYIDKDSQLFCFDGENTLKIADSVMSYNKIKDETGIVYLKGSYDEGFEVCGVSFDNPTEEVFLADDMTDIMLADDQEHIVCRRSTDEYSEDSYLAFMAGFGKEAEELGTPVSDMYAWDNDVVYYFASDENTACMLEDFVIDSRGDTEEWQALQEKWQSGESGISEEFQSLYEYKDGKITKLTDKDAESAGFYKGNSVLYINYENYVPVDLAEVSEDDSLYEVMDEEVTEHCIYMKAADRKDAVHITGKAAEDLTELFDEDNNFLIEMNETDIFLTSTGTFLHAVIQDDEVSEFEEMPDGYVKAITPEKIYYATNWYSEGENSYYDINVCEKGKNRCLATQVLEDYAQIFADGTVVAYTDANSDREYELSVFDKKGNRTVIADGVTQVIRKEDGDILYNKRGDLMLYKNGESERIGIGVLDVWYADEMEAEQNFRLNW